MIKTEQLYYLSQVAKYNSINKTAEHLFMTSAAISTSIKQLEKECGYDLLERTYRGVRLTTAGKEVVKIAEQILSLHDEILHLKTKKQEITQKYHLISDPQCLKLLAQKIVWPGAKVLNYFEVQEVNDLRANYKEYLRQEAILLLISTKDEREEYENNENISIRYLYASKYYPVSSPNTKWIKSNQDRVTEEEFAKLPKIKMWEEVDIMNTQENVVMTTTDATMYTEAIKNDYGVGAIARFAPDVYAIDASKLKIYEPFDIEAYIAIIGNKKSGTEAMNLLESLLKK